MDKHINKLVSTKEKVWFFIVNCLSPAVLFLNACIFLGNMMYAYNNVITENTSIYHPTLPFFSPFFILIAMLVIYLSFLVTASITSAMFIGYLKQNSVRVSREQFAGIYEIVEDYSKKLGLKKTPKVYIKQSGGVLNAFATGFLFRGIIVIFSDILELAYAQGEDAVRFIIAHELAHVKRKHMLKRLIAVWGAALPLIGHVYSRACETTCDNIATYLSDKNPENGLLVLLAGKKLYPKVKIDTFLRDTEKEKGFWSCLSEIISSHPNLSTRIKNVSKTKNTILGM